MSSKFVGLVVLYVVFLVYLMFLVFEIDRDGELDMWSFFVIEVDLKLVFGRELWRMYEIEGFLEIIFDRFDKLYVGDIKKKVERSFGIMMVVVNFS